MNSRNLFAAALLSAALLLLAGCTSKPAEVAPEDAEPVVSQRPVRVLVVEDALLAAALERQWQARSDQPIRLEQASASDFSAPAPEPPFAADVVIYPSGLMGTLVERELLEPIDDQQLDEADGQRDDVFDLIRLHETHWGGDVYAVPLGSPQLTLWYRKDVLAKLGSPPPETWDDYQRLVELCGDRTALGELVPAEGEWTATSEPLGPGWAGLVLLARASPYARHPSQLSTWFDRRTMQPLIDGAPFLRALDELAATARFAPAEATSRSPTDVRGDFLEGRCAFALTWPTAASPMPANSAAARSAGFAELPGSRDAFNVRTGTWEAHGDDQVIRVPLLATAGRLASLTRSGHRVAAAETMLIWLGGREVADELGPQSTSTTLFRQSQVPLATNWVGPGITAEAARQYGELVEHTQNRAAWLLAPRLPGRERYLAALDEAVHRVLAGSADSRQALQSAAEQWEAITDEFGRDAQRNAYAQSIGLKP